MNSISEMVIRLVGSTMAKVKVSPILLTGRIRVRRQFCSLTISRTDRSISKWERLIAGILCCLERVSAMSSSVTMFRLMRMEPRRPPFCFWKLRASFSCESEISPSLRRSSPSLYAMCNYCRERFFICQPNSVSTLSLQMSLLSEGGNRNNFDGTVSTLC